MTKIFGFLMAGIIIMIFLYSIVLNLFSLLFRDGQGTSMYGGRGDINMSDNQ